MEWPGVGQSAVVGSRRFANGNVFFQNLRAGKNAGYGEIGHLLNPTLSRTAPSSPGYPSTQKYRTCPLEGLLMTIFYPKPKFQHTLQALLLYKTHGLRRRSAIVQVDQIQASGQVRYGNRQNITSVGCLYDLLHDQATRYVGNAQ